MRSDSDTTYRIVVGVDGSDGGDRALRFAVAEASRRGGTVQAVTAWTGDSTDSTVLAPPDRLAASQRATDALARAVDAVSAIHPDVTVAGELVEGPAATVLVDAARHADILVLGSHGHSRLRHAVVGSVAEACIRAATCPVVVVPVSQESGAPRSTELQAT